jgi:hypothetical protein
MATLRNSAEARVEVVKFLCGNKPGIRVYVLLIYLFKVKKEHVGYAKSIFRFQFRDSK